MAAAEKVIDKLTEKLKNIGLSVEDYYYISETFYNKDEDDNLEDNIQDIEENEGDAGSETGGDQGKVSYAAGAGENVEFFDRLREIGEKSV